MNTEGASSPLSRSTATADGRRRAGAWTTTTVSSEARRRAWSSRSLRAIPYRDRRIQRTPIRPPRHPATRPRETAERPIPTTRNWARSPAATSPARLPNSTAASAAPEARRQGKGSQILIVPLAGLCAAAERRCPFLCNARIAARAWPGSAKNPRSVLGAIDCLCPPPCGDADDSKRVRLNRGEGPNDNRNPCAIAARASRSPPDRGSASCRSARRGERICRGRGRRERSLPTSRQRCHVAAGGRSASHCVAPWPRKRLSG